MRASQSVAGFSWYGYHRCRLPVDGHTLLPCDGNLLDPKPMMTDCQSNVPVSVSTIFWKSVWRTFTLMPTLEHSSVIICAMSFCMVFVAADRKSTRLNSSHQIISYAVFCLKK